MIAADMMTIKNTFQSISEALPTNRKNVCFHKSSWRFEKKGKLWNRGKAAVQSFCS